MICIDQVDQLRSVDGDQKGNASFHIGSVMHNSMEPRIMIIVRHPRLNDERISKIAIP